MITTQPVSGVPGQAPICALRGPIKDGHTWPKPPSRGRAGDVQAKSSSLLWLVASVVPTQYRPLEGTQVRGRNEGAYVVPPVTAEGRTRWNSDGGVWWARAGPGR